MSAERVKRSQYFSPPATECPHSSRNHFEDWEEFHLPMARMHHTALHGRGVASGLEVSVQDAGTQIEVGPGVAVDGKGELIALSAAGQADSGGEQPGETGQPIDPPFRLGIAGRDPGAYYLCIQFARALRFGEGSCGKLEQTPILRLLPTAGDVTSIEAGEAIVLAIVEVDAAGIATVRDRAEALPHRRQLVGQWGSELRIRRTDTAAEAVADAPAARIGARDGGGLRFSVADAADAIILDAEDGGQFSRLEVQADEARLAGDVEVLGSLGLASWRLQAGGSEPDPTLDLQPIADEKSFRLVSHDGGHVPLQVRPSSSGDGNAVYLAQTGGRVGIGTTTPGEQLDVAGRVKAGPMSIGPWPANVANYVFVGVNTLDQGAAGNYALLQGVTDGPGRTYLNSPIDIHFRIQNADRMILTQAVLTIDVPLHLTAGAQGEPNLTFRYNAAPDGVVNLNQMIGWIERLWSQVGFGRLFPT